MQSILNKQKQNGAALVIGLILLVVLTVLTASSMNSSTVSLRLADNVKQSELAFQAAESAIQESIKYGPSLAITSNIVHNQPIKRDGVNLVEPYSYQVETTSGNYSTITAEVATIYKDTLVPVYGNDEGLNVHFELQATGTAGRGARTGHGQGFYVFAPSN